MRARVIVAYMIAFLFVLRVHGQEKPTHYNLAELSKANQLEAYNREVSSFSENGKSGIRFSEKENDGIAWLKGATFSDGIIEVDIKGKDVLQQSFVGVAFHGADDKQFEVIYFRPFNFQAQDSVRRIHAVQYVSLPDFDWQRLRQEQNGKYEKAIGLKVNPNDWFHAKIVVQYPQIQVFINGESKVSLQVEQLSNRRTGKLGLWVGNQSDGDFANLTVVNKKSPAE
ncbi:hypothetical protein AHMF7605_17250 [Adhaeribacter arboris]|uniref:3-keto-alpha-glucoside-1,2-lyase/3-keto-2-hydroxy-glucal hydratase domain-containing protein n=1 Tax=Adhaeribacter arboris TaxID=2072846 RepID=A0A2T2YHY3_9BACT|nr:family 16 glycoside hydrolase [Adhaeribacter arboris]PSR55126.1 hypothetical protein AHMF7605_17250 [Adhaeribacter arboris]